MKHDQKCIDATNAVNQLSLIRNDRYYPLMHFAPPAGWINDPNGLIYFNHKYHLFYQHYPYSGYRGPMHWGHAISEDLLRWTHLPVALAPGDVGDTDGVYSGSAIEHDGQMFLFYTGHTVISSDDQDCKIRQVQMLATSSDGLNFTKHGIVITPPAHIQHFRDPKVWKDGNVWKMVVGVSEDDVGQVWQYHSTDLYHWEFDQVLLKAKVNQGWMWECPDFFRLNNKWVLVVSPMGMAAKGFEYNNYFQVGYFVGKMVNNQFVVERYFTELDKGFDLYAPQTYSGTGDKRIMLSWFSMPETEIPEKTDHWSSCLTFPRQITLNHDNCLVQQPISQIKSLRQSATTIKQLVLEDDVIVLPAKGAANELQFEIDLTKLQSERVGVILNYDAYTQSGVRLYVDRQSRRLYLDRTMTQIGSKGIRSISLNNIDKLMLRILIDKSSCEVFVNGGIATLSARIYSNNTLNRMALYAENGLATFNNISCWQLQSVWIPYFPNR